MAGLDPAPDVVQIASTALRRGVASPALSRAGPCAAGVGEAAAGCGGFEDLAVEGARGLPAAGVAALG